MGWNPNGRPPPRGNRTGIAQNKPALLPARGNTRKVARRSRALAPEPARSPRPPQYTVGLINVAPAAWTPPVRVSLHPFLQRLKDLAPSRDGKAGSQNRVKHRGSSQPLHGSVCFVLLENKNSAPGPCQVNNKLICALFYK